MGKIMNGNGLAEEDILYEDASIIVCRKRAGMATQTARLGEQDLESALKNYWKASYVAVIHRLDQPVEGILVFARTKEAAAGLSRQSAGQIMNKKYYAVAIMDAQRMDFFRGNSGMAYSFGNGPRMEGIGEAPAFRIGASAADFFMEEGKEQVLVDYLQRNGRENISKVVDKNAKDGKRAELIYEVLAAREVLWENGDDTDISGMETEAAVRKKIALLRVQLKTGRHHQIRVQMAHGGMPLLGDGKYGSMESKDYSRRMGIKNIALCAYSLEFIHPLTGRKMNFEITPKGMAFAPFFQCACCKVRANTQIR